MHVTIYKINDQDPLYNTRTLTPYSVITYMEKTQYVLVEVKLVVVEGKKNHQQDCNSPIHSSSNDEIKGAKKKC